MTVRETIRNLATRRPSRGITVSDAMKKLWESGNKVSRSTVSAAMAETLYRSSDFRPGLKGRSNSVYYVSA